ncbi:hypothetical protein HII36_19590 [Nonomuraea sp. NN258]|uniref:hypothetical protein n=1 Tax=Nonomuraea antri TaxID=2730852 RepID=UPI001569BCD2|nr:hypothetical protein [Nonomuraea antri]NRQ34038.1 hypothetical protein [Nonomuraea antri]
MTDVHGRRWSIFDKAPIFDDGNRLTPEAAYPQEVEIACEIVAAVTGPDGREALVISTDKPWGVAAAEGQTEFQVSRDQLVPPG